MERNITSKWYYFMLKLAPWINAEAKYTAAPGDLKALYFLREQTALYAGNIYLGTDADLELLERAVIYPGTVVLLCGNTLTELDLVRGIRDYCLFGISLPALDIYNILQDMLGSYILSRERLLEQGLEQFKPERMILTAAELTGAELFLLNPSGYLIAESGGVHDHSWIDGYLAGKGCFADPLKLGAGGDKGEECLISRDESSGITYYTVPVRFQNKLEAEVILRTDREPAACDFATVMLMTGRSIERRLISSNMRAFEENVGFSDFLDLVLENRLSTEAEIEHQLQMLPERISRYLQCLIAAFEENGARTELYYQLMIRLREFFPAANMTLYRGKIVILCSREERLGSEAVQFEEMEALLKEYSAVLTIGPAFKRHENMRTLYLLTEKLGDIAQKVRLDPQERIFTADKYGIYLIIDGALHDYTRLYQHADYAYLLHPAAIELLNYDNEHGTNLRQMLFIYLLNDRNLNATAAQTFMHRNTILNKISRITSLTGIDLSDPLTQQRMLVSCQTLHYSEKYLDNDLSESRALPYHC